MKDLSSLFFELSQRDDDGKRFYQDVILDHEYHLVKNKKGVIVDIGANIGNFSYYMYNNADVIYSIEANKVNYDMLKMYVDNYNLTKIKPYHLAIAGADGNRTLYKHQGCGGYTIFGDAGDECGTVQAKSLYSFFKDNNITHVDLLKIDVEGTEDEIFRAPSFAVCAPFIDTIIGELHRGADIEEILKMNHYKLTYTKRSLFLAERIV